LLLQFEFVESWCYPGLVFQVPLMYPPCLWHSQDTTSDELKDFFETQTGCEVAEVSIARDNARLVTLSINRGKLVRKLEVCAARVFFKC
jgi:hypothetical protein